MTVADRVRDVVLPVLASHEVGLYDIEVQDHLIRVAIDREGGIDLDVLAAVTRGVSRALDDADPISSRYTLEVTTPGVERRLRSPEQFAKAVGEVVRVRTMTNVPGDRRVEGVLADADDDGITIRTGLEAKADGAEGGEPAMRSLAYDEIERARTVFEWGTPGPKPGQAPGAASSRKKRERNP